MSERVKKVVPAWAKGSLGTGACRLRSRRTGWDEENWMVGAHGVFGALMYPGVQKIRMMRCPPGPGAASLFNVLYIS